MNTYKSPERITALNYDNVLNDLMSLISTGTNVTIDMSETTYLSSAGLRTLLMSAKILRSKGMKPLRIINIRDSVKSVIEIVCFDEFLDIEQ